MRALPLLAGAALALAAGACAAPDRSPGRAASAETSPADAAGGSAKARAGQSRWKLSQYRREADFEPWVYGDVRPGKGLLSKDGDGFVLYREGEIGSSDSTKPSKVRR